MSEGPGRRERGERRRGPSKDGERDKDSNAANASASASAPSASAAATLAAMTAAGRSMVGTSGQEIEQARVCVERARVCYEQRSSKECRAYCNEGIRLLTIANTATTATSSASASASASSSPPSLGDSEAIGLKLDLHALHAVCCSFLQPPDWLAACQEADNAIELHNKIETDGLAYPYFEGVCQALKARARAKEALGLLEQCRGDCLEYLRVHKGWTRWLMAKGEGAPYLGRDLESAAEEKGEVEVLLNRIDSKGGVGGAGGQNNTNNTNTNNTSHNNGDDGIGIFRYTACLGPHPLDHLHSQQPTGTDNTNAHNPPLALPAASAAAPGPAASSAAAAPPAGPQSLFPPSQDQDPPSHNPSLSPAPPPPSRDPHTNTNTNTNTNSNTNTAEVRGKDKRVAGRSGGKEGAGKRQQQASNPHNTNPTTNGTKQAVSLAALAGTNYLQQQNQQQQQQQEAGRVGILQRLHSLHKEEHELRMMLSRQQKQQAFLEKEIGAVHKRSEICALELCDERIRHNHTMRLLEEERAAFHKTMVDVQTQNSALTEKNKHLESMLSTYKNREALRGSVSPYSDYFWATSEARVKTSCVSDLEALKTNIENAQRAIFNTQSTLSLLVEYANEEAERLNEVQEQVKAKMASLILVELRDHKDHHQQQQQEQQGEEEQELSEDGWEHVGGTHDKKHGGRGRKRP